MYQLRGAFVLLLALVSSTRSQQYDPRARATGRLPYLRNQNPLYNFRHLIGRQNPPYWPSLRNTPAKHLDLGLPMSILGSDDSLLLHLKDSDLWKKENAGRGQNLKAALMPMYLKSLERNEPREDAVTPEEPEEHVPSASDPKHLLSKLFEHFDQDADLTDEAEERLAEIIDEVKTEDKLGLTFNLRDAFKRLFEKSLPASDAEGTNHPHEAKKNPGAFFNLKDLEKHFEQMYESMHGDDGLPEFVQKDDQGGVSFNLADIIKEELALEKEKAKANGLTEKNTDGLEEIDLNEKLAEGLRNSNMPVRTGENGGLYFSLNNTQE